MDEVRKKRDCGRLPGDLRLASSTICHLVGSLCLLLSIFGCSPDPVKVKDGTPFKTVDHETRIPYATPEELRIYEANLDKQYLIGPGDRIKIEVWGREDLSREHLVGPHGLITLPMVGVFSRH